MFTTSQKKALKKLAPYAARGNRRDHMAHRAALAEQIKAHAEGGQIGIFWSATDCDHCRGEGFDIIPAQPMALERWVYRFAANAEGPQSWSLAAPSEADEGVHDVRDLALEAFEDGHPHFISY